MVRWFGWSLFALAVLGAAVGAAMFVSGDSVEWLGVVVRDPNKNWVGVVLAVMGAGWLLARMNR